MAIGTSRVAQGPARPRMEGRQRELGLVSGAIAARAGRSEGPGHSILTVVLVEGEAGVGKSRLVAEALRDPRARTRGALVTVCPPTRARYTLAAVVEGVRRAVTDVRALRLTSVCGVLAGMLPEWADDLPAPLASLDGAEATRYRVYQALGEVLTRAGVEVLVVEDAHWADEATLEFLLYVASVSSGVRCIIATHRPEDHEAGTLLPRLGRLAAAGPGVRLELGRLDRVAVRRVVSSMLGDQPVSQSLVELVFRETGGLPLAVEESVKLLTGRSELHRRNGAWMRPVEAPLPLPPTLSDLVRERFEALSPVTREVVQALAILGTPSTAGVLSTIVDRSLREATDALVEAGGHGLVVDDVEGRSSFWHSLGARAVAESIPGPIRRLLHARASHALADARPRVSAAVIAEHARLGGDEARWREYAERAAQEALATGDELVSSHLLQDLLIEGEINPEDGARLVEELRFPSCDSSAITQILARLRRLLGEPGLGQELEAKLRFALGRGLLTMEDAGAWDELAAAYPHLGEGYLTRAKIALAFAWPERWEWSAREHVEWLHAAEREVDLCGSAVPDNFRIHVARARIMLGDERAWEEIGRRLPLAVAPSDLHDPDRRGSETAVQLLNLGDEAMLWGRYAPARACLAAAERALLEERYPLLSGAVDGTRLRLDWCTGEWGHLATRGRRILDEGATAGDGGTEIELVLALHDIARGLWDRGRRILVDISSGAGDGRVHGPIVTARAALAALMVDEGAAGDALALTDSDTEMVLRKELWVLATELLPARVRALLARGKVDEARELVSHVRARLGDRSAPAPQAARRMASALIVEATESPESAAGAFREAAAAWDAMPRPYDAAQAQVAEARCLLAVGNQLGARQVLEIAVSRFRALGATRDLRALENSALSERCGAPSEPDSALERLASLSPRELEVVRLVVQGQTNKAIAAALHRSPSTVDTQLQSAMRKLQVSSRTALAVSAVDRGLVDRD